MLAVRVSGSRMITTLGGEATLCAPVGGESGIVIRALVEAEDIKLRGIEAHQWNGGYVHDRRRGDREVISEMKGPTLNRHELDDLYGAVVSASLKNGVAVLTGVPDSEMVPADFYRRLALDLQANHVAVVADLSGAALKGIKDGLTFLKVSHEEVMAAGYCSDDSANSIRAGMRDLRKASGAKNLVVSRADQPAFAILDGREVAATPPRFRPLDHRGAGDSMTAALAIAHSEEMSPEQALRLASAAGAMNVTRHGLGTGTGNDIREVADQVTIASL